MKNNKTLTKGIIDHNVSYRVSGTRGYFLPTPIIILEGTNSYISCVETWSIMYLCGSIFYVNMCLIFINIFSKIINLPRLVIKLTI